MSLNLINVSWNSILGRFWHHHQWRGACDLADQRGQQGLFAHGQELVHRGSSLRNQVERSTSSTSPTVSSQTIVWRHIRENLGQEDPIEVTFTTMVGRIAGFRILGGQSKFQYEANLFSFGALWVWGGWPQKGRHFICFWILNITGSFQINFLDTRSTLGTQ